ncbi:MAG: Asp-tRNA(Asn)/Glu-tRNA(Gln) amidotransferase subunit GatB [Myxococcales bacterium]|nr:Asp-tRNA(Asn)/Glu-tRNA(Gln) amidotransferase subunit GatB [Myxococcales bacterium]HIK86420.1 Asp-tRNA(Asn)/Glu-tRNA(Gln) amidotransferase subunit GatB [Myxococcales bacterium]
MASELDRYEIVIGLEVHTHLKTASKLFSPAPVLYGEEPNHSVHAIDLALPGVLPVLNERVVELAIRLGLAIHGTVNPRSVFARKNYFYPDLPKGYQISQFEDPVVSGGWLEIEVNGKGEGKSASVGNAKTSMRRIGITRAHLEEDAGKSIHDVAIAGRDDSCIDLNRAGVPLLEIVSEPDLRSAQEATAYLRELRAILRYIGVSDADMEKGQFRCDANVSIRPHGSQELGTRTEVKNLNSFSNVEDAIEAEALRQRELIADGGEVVQATMGFDPVRRRTSVQRLKENSDDYRYFPDPDLIPLRIDPAQIEAVRAELPELPGDKRARFESELGLSGYDAGVLTANRGLADFFEQTAKACSAPKAAANWMTRDLLRELKERDVELSEMAITPHILASMIRLIEEGRLTSRNAAQLFPILVSEGGDPEALMIARGLEAVSDSGTIDGFVDAVIAGHSDVVEQIRGGDDKPLNFLMGQVMKASQGKADPGQVRQKLIDKIRG